MSGDAFIGWRRDLNGPSCWTKDAHDIFGDMPITTRSATLPEQRHAAAVTLAELALKSGVEDDLAFALGAVGVP